jgi:V/A-type H+-transporting ATPase subunit C
MLFSSASNAVLSKARAMYGKCLRRDDFVNLSMCSDLPAILLYLKNHTSYSGVLDGFNETEIHRGRFEGLLRQKLFDDFSILGKYDLSVGEHFLKYMVARVEIHEMMHILMLMFANKTGEYMCRVPAFFDRHTKIEFHAFSDVKNYDDFLDAIKKSEYYKPFLLFKPESGNGIPDLTRVETVLYTHLYDIFFEVVNKYMRGSPRKLLFDMISTYVDLSNIVRITRLKKFYCVDGAYIESVLFPFGNLGIKVLRGYIAERDNKTMMEKMKKSTIGRKWLSRGLDILDKVPKYMRFMVSRHNIRFSISPPVVLMSYIFLKEAEILNIVSVIEGVRYKLSAERIRSMLIR